MPAVETGRDELLKPSLASLDVPLQLT